ncbi:RNA pol II accessory factor, Cdc73 family-domain-containing protein [Apodospora peruviana]|uniref:RNA pol II accessory factor, Cdc73 family-domain-containing protein n=1 Tax=Apodospora peruviana TaxID=516989 RepID=A0AAE0I510_9PEZI|nr:RNA pol II accessory factor, Cdc73 family-domain-containing protein [Apodospora peruviana]
MATPTTQLDPLLLLRQSIGSGSAIIPTTSADVSSETLPAEAPLSQATHLLFTSPTRVAIPIDTPTRFVSAKEKVVDLRSCYFAWLNREVAIPEYNADTAKLNDELRQHGVTGSGGGDGDDGDAVYMFAFVERLELFTWLEGASEESDFIKKLPGEKDGLGGAGAAGGVQSGAAAPMTKAAASKADGAVVSQARAGRGTLDPRLLQIYSGERRVGDRNSVLRGVKPIDFSHVRKLAAPFMSRKPSPAATSIANNPALALNQKPQRRPDPIVLLSPSASALLRLSNVKSFLEGGRYTPPDHNSAVSMLHISRLMKDIDPNRPMRFILVESSEQFKPEYWNRVVAVFTTGQAWQFKKFPWTDPNELFRHVLGIYLGWRDEPLPEVIRSFGHRVLACQIGKHTGGGAGGAQSVPAANSQADNSRYRDREVMETMWKAIEVNMRTKGWRKDAAPDKI